MVKTAVVGIECSSLSSLIFSTCNLIFQDHSSAVLYAACFFMGVFDRLKSGIVLCYVGMLYGLHRIFFTMITVGKVINI